MPDEADPPRKHYGFKEREFKRDNAPASAAPPPPTAKELAIMSGQKISSAPKPPTGAKADLPAAALAKAGDPNDVFAVLQANRAVEQQAGLNEVEIRTVKSRRRRDYVFLLIGGNLAILGAVALGGFNIMSVIFGLSGLVMFNLGLTWVMWQVMGKY